MDTDVMFAAIDSPKGASRQLLLHALDGDIQVVISTTLIVEYQVVLTRTTSLSRFSLTAEDVLYVLDELSDCAVYADFDYRWRPMAKDPDDDHVLETAINGGANAIATFNIKDFGNEAARFGIALQEPGNILRRIRQ